MGESLLKTAADLSPAKRALLEKRLRGQRPARTKGQEIASTPRPLRIPLSFAQQRLWFLDRLQGGSAEYNTSSAVRLTGTLDLPTFARAIDTLVERHEILRTHFADGDGDPIQVISPTLRMTVPVEDVTALDASAQQAVITDAMRREREEAFDLQRGPLLRLKLLKLNERHHVLLQTIHHIISDQWSEGVFNRELAILYEAFLEGRPNPLEPLKAQYSQFAVWQRNRLRGRPL